MEGRRLLLDAIVAAAESPNGLGFRVSGGTRALVAFAVRTPERVTVDVGPAREVARSPASAWTELAPWRQAERENVAASLRWAAAPERIVLPACALERTSGGDGEIARLVRACVESPDDDDARAVLGDALLGRGDAWGELCALQLFWAPYLLGGPQRRRVQALEERLVKAVTRTAMPPALGYARAVRFRRGLIDEIGVSGTVFQKHGAEMTAHAPIRRLRLTPNTPSTLAALLATPALAKIRQLDLGERTATKEDLALVCRSPNLASLETLELGTSAVLDADDLARLRDTAWSTRLRGLACQPSEAAAAELARDPSTLPALSRLAVGRCGAAALIGVLAQRELVWLDAGPCDRPLDELLADGRGRALVWLKCSRQPERGASALSELARLRAPLPALRALFLSPSFRVEREELRLLAEAPALASLRALVAELTLHTLDEEEAGWLLGHPALRLVTLSEHGTSLLTAETRARLDRIAEYGHVWNVTALATEAFLASDEVLRRAAVAPDDAVPDLARGEVAAAEAPAARTRLEIAGASDASPEALRALVDGLSEDEAEALAANRAAPADVLAALADPRRKPPLRRLSAIAGHAGCDDALLRTLATSKSKRVRELVTAHPAASAETLRAVFDTNTLTEALVLHPNLPRDVLAAIVAGPDASLWRVAPKIAALPAAERAALLAKPDAATVVATLGRHDVTAPEIEAALDAWPDHCEVAIAAAEHPAATPAIAERVAVWAERCATVSELDRRRVIVALASRPATPGARLDRIAAAFDDDPLVTERLAQNPGASAALLDRLAASSWQQVAKNPSASPALLAELAARGAVGLELVAQNPACPPQELARALAHASADVRGAAARNPSLAPERLAALVRAGDEHLRAGAAKNPSLPPALAQALAEDPSPRVWLALAENPAAAPSLLERVAARGGHIPAIKNALLRHAALPLAAARAL